MHSLAMLAVDGASVPMGPITLYHYLFLACAMFALYPPVTPFRG